MLHWKIGMTKNRWLLQLVLVAILLVVFLFIESYLQATYSFEICQFLGGSVYVVDSPFAGARECHIRSKSFNEADNWEHTYQQFHE